MFSDNSPLKDHFGEGHEQEKYVEQASKHLNEFFKPFLLTKFVILYMPCKKYLTYFYEHVDFLRAMKSLSWGGGGKNFSKLKNFEIFKKFWLFKTSIFQIFTTLPHLRKSCHLRSYMLEM